MLIIVNNTIFLFCKGTTFKQKYFKFKRTFQARSEIALIFFYFQTTFLNVNYFRELKMQKPEKCIQ